MKFSVFVEKWKRLCRLKVSLGWQKSQDQMIRDYVLGFLAVKTLNSIKPEDILEIFAYIIELKRSSQLQRHVYNLLKSIFDSAIDVFGLIDENPVKKKFMPAVQSIEPKFLHFEHSFMLMAHVSTHRYRLAFYINLLCGLRVGEIQALTWDCVDWKKEELRIIKHYCRKTRRIIPRTKNGKELRVPIPLYLFNILKKSRKLSGYVINCDGRMMHQMNYHKAIKKACREIGIPLISSHGLRHSCSEIWEAYDANDSDLQKLLNHASEKSTRRYRHSANSRIKAIAKRMHFKRVKKVS